MVPPWEGDPSSSKRGEARTIDSVGRAAQGAGRERPVPARGRTGGASRQLLLKATGEILAERGSLDISLGEIAQRSGLNSALIKYYFGNKEGLLLALVERDSSAGLRSLAQLVESNLSAEKKLRIHINGMISALHRAPYLNKLIRRLNNDGKRELSKRLSEEYSKPIVEAYRAILEQGHREGTMRRCDPLLFFFSLVGACDYIFNEGANIAQLIGNEGITDKLIERYSAHVAEIFLGSLACPDAETPDAGRL